MKRSIVTLPATLLLICICMVQPAHAGLADWLDKLEKMSGPGPFHKWFGASVDIVCIEGAWWERPDDATAPRELTSDAVRLLQADISRALLGRTPQESLANDPMAIAYLLDALTRDVRPRSTDPAIQAARVADLFDQYRSSRAAAIPILLSRLRLVLWQMREDLIALQDEKPLARILGRYGLADDDFMKFWSRVESAFDRSHRVRVNFGCVGDLRKARLNFGVAGSWFTTGSIPTNPAEEEDDVYVYEPSRSGLSPIVNAVPIAFTMEGVPPLPWPTVMRSVDLGLAIGGIRFFAGGKDKRFRPFTRFYLEIPRVTVRPLAWIACHKANRCPSQWTVWDLLETEFVGKYIPPVDPTQFGAISGPSPERHYDFWLRIGMSFKFNNDQTPAVLIR